jgi:hypothetical protein
MAESKSDNFSLEINAHSEKIAKFDPLSTNRLAADSEYRSTFALREVNSLIAGQSVEVGHSLPLQNCPIYQPASAMAHDQQSIEKPLVLDEVGAPLDLVTGAPRHDRHSGGRVLR